jgi:hypothetical protein
MRDLCVEKLSDEFGQYELSLSFEGGHVRRCTPIPLAAFAGWGAKLE